MATLVPRYTAAEIRRFPDDRVRYEVIRGDLFVTPAPGTSHQRAIVELVVRLHSYLTTHRLGEALAAPFEVQFAADSAVQPDVIALLDRDKPRLTRKRLYGSPPPALVIEIVSHSSRRTDRLQKRQLYQDAGVPEYWIVDVDQRQVERWQLGNNRAEIVTGRLVWQPDPALHPLEIDLPALFDIINR
jgi:Uma2 family endonuclease